MKLKILGSGGGEGYPALFCSCTHCTAARKAGGRSLRTLSQSLIDDELLIDLPADTHMHCLQHGIDLGSIAHLFITHTHGDHYVPNLLDSRGTDFAPVMREKQLHIYGNADVKRCYDGVAQFFPVRREIRENILFHELTPGVTLTIGKYLITPIRAYHALDQVALNYIIDDGKSALLYLVDSGFPKEETWEFLKAYPSAFSCVVMDVTMGVNYYECHMNFQENIVLRERLLAMGKAVEHTRFLTAHITHNHAGLHEEIEAYFRGTGVEPSYDGMELEF